MTRPRRARERSRAHVGAQHEDRLPAEQERAAVEHLVDAVDELSLLNLGGDHEGDDADQDPAASAAIPAHFSHLRQAGRSPGILSGFGSGSESSPRPKRRPQSGEVGLADAVPQPRPRAVDVVLGRLGPRGLLG